MDNLAHSLVGTVVGRMALKTTTGLAMPTLTAPDAIADDAMAAHRE